MIVTREDDTVKSLLKTFKKLIEGKNRESLYVFHEADERLKLLHPYQVKFIIQVLEDRLNQVDYKSLAEEQNKTLLLCKKDYEGIRRACKKYGFENTFKDCGESIEYIDNVISKYEQAIKGE